jgi:hypothetical protein
LYQEVAIDENTNSDKTLLGKYVGCGSSLEPVPLQRESYKAAWKKRMSNLVRTTAP